MLACAQPRPVRGDDSRVCRGTVEIPESWLDGQEEEMEEKTALVLLCRSRAIWCCGRTKRRISKRTWSSKRTWMSRDKDTTTAARLSCSVRQPGAVQRVESASGP